MAHCRTKLRLGAASACACKCPSFCYHIRSLTGTCSATITSGLGDRQLLCEESVSSCELLCVACCAANEKWRRCSPECHPGTGCCLFQSASMTVVEPCKPLQAAFRGMLCFATHVPPLSWHVAPFFWSVYLCLQVCFAMCCMAGGNPLIKIHAMSFDGLCGGARFCPGAL